MSEGRRQWRGRRLIFIRIKLASVFIRCDLSLLSPAGGRPYLLATPLPPTPYLRSAIGDRLPSVICNRRSAPISDLRSAIGLRHGRAGAFCGLLAPSGAFWCLWCLLVPSCVFGAFWCLLMHSGAFWCLWRLLLGPSGLLVPFGAF